MPYVIKDAVEGTCRTTGDGLWSRSKRVVPITAFRFRNENEIRVYFKSWDVRRHGLIYTDRGFLRDIRKLLKVCYPDLNVRRVQYTEQGMQGSTFVSLQLT